MLLYTQKLTNTFYYLEMHTFICNLNRNACLKLAVNISVKFIFTEKKVCLHNEWEQFNNMK